VSLESDDDGDDELGAEVQNISADTETKPKKKKKNKKKKLSAEEQAKAAEEALLMELAQEDAERHKQEQEANKKSAKKKKKKERERQLKKEQEEKRLAEEKAKEEQRQKEQEAREAAEKAERERIAAARKKEELELRKKQEEAIRTQQQEEERRKKQEEKEAEKKKSTQRQKEPGKISKNGQIVQGKNKGEKGAWNAPKGQQPSSVKVLPKLASTPVKAGAPGGPKPANAVKKRGWESLPSSKPEPSAANSASASNGTNPRSPSLAPSGSAKEPVAALRPVQGRPNESATVTVNATEPANSSAAPSGSRTPIGKPARSPESKSSVSKSSSPATVTTANTISSPVHNSMEMEHPAVSIFRREKVSELLHRCSIAQLSSDPLGFVDESIIRNVLYRWVIRAAHERSEYIDFLIPSWSDLEKLTTFFQRQFISETRKGMGSSSMLSMESLKDAGTAMANLCFGLAKTVSGFRQQLQQQLPAGWNDVNVGMTASEITQHLSNGSVVIDWAKQTQIYLPTLVFSKLRERHQGQQSRLLSAIFVSKVCYDTILLLTGETSMDYRLLPATKSKVSLQLSVSAEIWSDPFSTLSGNEFWGQFAETDIVFGGSRPFGSLDGNDDLLLRQGGSVVVVTPPDNMLTSRYIQRMIEILQNGKAVPLSFAVFIRSDCLVDRSPAPSLNDLYTLEPRLRDAMEFICRVESLQEGRHCYFSERLGAPTVSTSGSLFLLLQNSLGRNHFALSDVAVAEILGSMKPDFSRANESTMGTPLAYNPEMHSTNTQQVFIPQTGYLEPSTGLPPSPMPHQPSVATDFGTIGRSASMPNSFATDPSPAAARRPGPRRGRLFDLVDDGEEDNMNDVVSGMLGTLNVDLFQNSAVQDVDIEAISLMGIGGSPGPNALQPRSTSQGRFG